jgi:hypothetical protein
MALGYGFLVRAAGVLTVLAALEDVFRQLRPLVLWLAETKSGYYTIPATALPDGTVVGWVAELLPH